MCSCRRPADCPLVGRCLEQCVIYKATVSSSEGDKFYLGATEQTFKNDSTITSRPSITRSMHQPPPSLSTSGTSREGASHTPSDGRSSTIAPLTNAEQGDVISVCQKNITFWQQTPTDAWTETLNSSKSVGIVTSTNLEASPRCTREPLDWIRAYHTHAIVYTYSIV